MSNRRTYGDRSKGPCKEFDLRRPFMLCWKPSQSLYSSSWTKIIAKVLPNMYTMNHDTFCILQCQINLIWLIKGYSTLPPTLGSSQGCGKWRVPENCGFVLVQFTVMLYSGDEPFPSFIRSSRASTGETSAQWYCLTLLSEVSRSKLQTQQPSFQQWGLREPNTKVRGGLFLLWWAPCWWRGSADRIILAKVPWESANRAKVKVHFEAGGSVSRPQKTAQSGTICPEKGLREEQE